MSDTGRKDFSNKAKEEITPDSSKSTQDKVKESVTNTTDRVVRGFQPHEQKSNTQSTLDQAQRTHNDKSRDSSAATVGDKVKNTLHIDQNQ